MTVRLSQAAPGHRAVLRLCHFRHFSQYQTANRQCFRGGLSVGTRRGSSAAPVWYKRCFGWIPLLYLRCGEHPMSKQPTVADYIVGRLAREGITDCFGVAGDFAFKLNDAIARSEAIRWIGCSNELDAAYAADGYARVRGCSMLMTSASSMPPWPGPLRGNRRATSRLSEAGWTSRRCWPWPISASTPCTRMIRTPSVCNRRGLGDPDRRKFGQKGCFHVRFR